MLRRFSRQGRGKRVRPACFAREAGSRVPSATGSCLMRGVRTAWSRAERGRRPSTNVRHRAVPSPPWLSKQIGRCSVFASIVAVLATSLVRPSQALCPHEVATVSLGHVGMMLQVGKHRQCEVPFSILFVAASRHTRGSPECHFPGSQSLLRACVRGMSAMLCDWSFRREALPPLSTRGSCTAVGLEWKPCLPPTFALTHLVPCVS